MIKQSALYGKKIAIAKIDFFYYFVFYYICSISMCARKDIRSLTYSDLAIKSEFSSRKWKPHCDEVFNKLGEMVKEKEQEMI